jgi:hypothetical protein
VYAFGAGGFKKTGGTISGYASDPNNGNAVRDDTGNIIARQGHAAYGCPAGLGSCVRKEKTVEPRVNLIFNMKGSSNIGWDD